MRSYHVHDSRTYHVWTTADTNQRRRLKRRGWRKVSRRDLEAFYGRKAVTDLAGMLVGRHIWTGNQTSMKQGGFVRATYQLEEA